MAVGESIKKGFGTAGKSMDLIAVLFVFGAIFSLINVFLTPANVDPNTPPPMGLVVSSVVFIFLSIFLQAGSMGFLRDKIKTGAATLGSFTANGGKYYLRLFLLGLIVSLVIGVFVMLAAVAVAFLQGALAPVGVILAIFCAALGVYFLVLLFLSPYAAVVDEKGVKDSLKTSMRLVKKNILPLVGMSLLLILIGFGIGLLLGAILAAVGFLVKNETASQIVFALLSSFVNAYLGVAVTGAFMTFYLGLPERNNNT